MGLFARYADALGARRVVVLAVPLILNLSSCRSGADTSTRRCPANPEDAGAACAVEGQQCSYGQGALARCRDVTTCTSSHIAWTPGSNACGSQSSVCPAGSLDGGTCEKGTSECVLDDGTQCLCLPCQGIGDAIWGCRQASPVYWWNCLPPPSPPCPTKAPNAGDPCSTSATCFYVDTCASCDGVQWSWFSPVGDSIPACIPR
jgi:hypothetical protein